MTSVRNSVSFLWQHNFCRWGDKCEARQGNGDKQQVPHGGKQPEESCQCVLLRLKF